MGFERLMFVGTKAFPVILGVGFLHLAVQEIINPVSPEQAAMLEHRRRRKGPRFSSDTIDSEASRNDEPIAPIPETTDHVD